MDNRTTNENGNLTRLQNRYLDTVYDTMSQYNENTSQYNSNMQNIIRILEETHSTYFASLRHTHGVNRVNAPVPRSTPRAAGGGPRRSNQSFFDYTRAASGGTRRSHSSNISQSRATSGGGTRSTIPPPLNRNGLDNNNSLLFTYLFQPEVGETQAVLLSSDEIARHTTTYGCSEEVFCDISGNRCPISLDNFEIGDVIMKITGCGHIFKRRALMRWFERSNNCPVCRYNLRETRIDNSNNSVPLVDNSNNSVPLVDNSNNIINEFNNTLTETLMR